MIAPLSRLFHRMLSLFRGDSLDHDFDPELTVYSRSNRPDPR